MSLRAFLVIKGRKVSLADRALIIGRLPSCDICLADDAQVSGRHAIFVPDRDLQGTLCHTLVDLRSSNGVKVNGDSETRRALAPGDVVQIGEHEILYELGEPAVRPADPPDEPPGVSPAAGSVEDEPDSGIAWVQDDPTEQTLSGMLAEPPAGSPTWALRLRRGRPGVAEQLATLIRVSRLLNSELDLDRQLPTLIDSALGVMRADRGALLLVDQSTGNLEVKIYRDGSSQQPPRHPPMPISQTIARYTAENRAPVLSSNPQNDPRFSDSRGGSIQFANIRSALCVPLITREKLLGVLYVDNRLESHSFTDQDRDLLVALADQASIALMNARLYRMAITDELTSLYIRRYFDHRLREEVERAVRYGGSLTVAVLDVDHFKRINDTYGHSTGDQVLRAVAAQMRRAVRNVDIVSRYGGEEFAVLFPEQDVDQCLVPAERLRAFMEGLELDSQGQTVRCTVSIGLADFPQGARTVEELVKRADQALYRAKRAGRNRICTSSPLEAEPDSES